MPKKSTLVLLATLVGGGFYLARSNGIDSLDKLARLLEPAATPSDDDLPPVAARSHEAIRIASLDISGMRDAPLDDARLAEHMAKIAARFDVLAVQGLAARHERLPKRVVDAANAAGASYAFVAGAPVGPAEERELFVFFFNQASVELDRESVYSVDDPHDAFLCDPLAAPFRVRGPAEDEAFTFTLVNVRLDERRPEAEYSLLSTLYRAVRNDGRDEDDAIVVGAFGVDTREETPPGGSARFDWAIADERREEPLMDNLFFDTRATSEFTGRSGALDAASDVDLSAEDVQALAERAPVWAEFSLVETTSP